MNRFFTSICVSPSIFQKHNTQTRLSLLHIAFIAYISFLFGETYWASIVLALGFFLFAILVDRIFDFLEFKRLLNDLMDITEKGVMSTPYPIEFSNYFGDEIGAHLNYGALKNIDFEVNSCKVFYMKPMQDNHFMGTFAFSPWPGQSFIFVPYGPDDLNPTKLLVLLHEYSHCMLSSWVCNRSYLSRPAACFLISLPYALVVSPLILFLIVPILLMEYHRSKMFSLSEEIMADARAFSILESIKSIAQEEVDLSEKGKRTLDIVNQILKRKRMAIPVDRSLFKYQNDFRKAYFELAFADMKGENIELDYLDQVKKIDSKQRMIDNLKSFFVIFLFVLGLLTLLVLPVGFLENVTLLGFNASLTVVALFFALGIAALYFVWRTTFKVFNRFGNTILRREDTFQAMGNQLGTGSNSKDILSNLAEEYVVTEFLAQYFLEFGGFDANLMHSCVNERMWERYCNNGAGRGMMEGIWDHVDQTPS